MAKGKKQPTPQEIYWARKQREEEEKDALLPPGLVNHGNTCFMNSTLQGLIATPLLHSLVNFEDSSASPSPSASTSTPTPASPPLPHILTRSPTISAHKSPQLTNGHGRGGEYERPWEQGMPLGDVFVALLQKAWGIQRSHVRQSISPKEVLTTIGRKYDQYLDFRQQDAHEFLTHMLDAIRLEEVDVIKKRQPSQPASAHAHKGKRRRTRSSVESASPHSHGDTEGATEGTGEGSSTPQAPENTQEGEQEQEKLTPFVDMVFGGKLASILVCDTCKKVSVTTEDFHDLSLSIKPEDYFNKEGQRKRDRFRGIAKKLRLIPKSGSGSSAPGGVRASGSGSGVGLGIGGIGMGMAGARGGRESGGDRASSVPASPVRSSLTLLEPGEHDHLGVGGERADPRRRSLEHISGNNNRHTNGDGSGPSEEDGVLVPNEDSDGGVVAAVPSGREDSGHVSFAEAALTEGEKKEDAWGKLGRRISMSMGGAARREKRLSRSKSNSRANSRERVGTSTPRLSASSPLVDGGGFIAAEGSPSTKGSPLPNSPSLPAPNSPAPSNTSGLFFSPSRQHSAVGLSDLIKQHKENHHQHHHQDKQPSRPYKPTREESAYMRELLADVNPSGSSTFSLIHQALSGHSPSSAPLTAQALLVKMGHLPGIEECLRLFTAVEVLDGDNMVGCHRCWKIANGTYKPRKDKDKFEDDSEEADDNDADDAEDEGEDGPILVEADGEPRPAVTRVDTASSLDTNSNLPGYISPASTTVINETVVDSSSSIFSADNASVSSAPTTVQSVTPPAPKMVPSPLNAQLLQQPVSPSSQTPDVPLPEYGGLPIPVISTTGPDTPVTSPAGVVGLQQAQEDDACARTAFITKGTLQPPSVRKRRVEDGVSGDESDDSDSDASGDTSALSDVSSLASPSASPLASPSASVERLGRTTTQESASQGHSDGSHSHRAPNGTAPLTAATTAGKAGKVPRSEQVILRRTYKRYLIASPPPVLVIHLKRFQQTSKSSYAMSFSSGFKKLDDFVAFPEYLDLKPFLAPRKEEFGVGRKKHKRKDKERESEKVGEGECMYRLYAVVVHIGNMLGGHYVAYTALPPSSASGSSRPSAEGSTSSVSGSASTEEKPSSSSSVPAAQRNGAEGKRQWAFISDTNVRLVSLEEVLKAKAYLCMYERI